MIRRLITDRDVSLGLVDSPIVLDAETLLTPAARDRAAVRGLVIVERDGSTSGAAGQAARGYPFEGRATVSGAVGAAGRTPAAQASAPGAGPAPALACPRCGRSDCAPACAPPAATCPATQAVQGLPDGLYLVRVEGGRPRSVLPAGGPG